MKPSSAMDLVHIAFRGLLAAGMALGVAWVTLPVAAYAMHLLKELQQSRLATAEAIDEVLLSLEAAPGYRPAQRLLLDLDKSANEPPKK